MSKPAVAAAWRNAALAYGGALLLGLVLVARLFPLAALDGTLTLTHPVFGDAAQHISGQRYFMADQWRWPPFRTPLIGPPPGVNTALTDDIPLMGLLGKLGFAALPAGAHLVFAWIALCFVLQPVAAVFALRGAGVRGVVAALAGALLAVSSPAFLFRFGHAALCAHFLIFLAIGVALRMVRAQAPARWAMAAALLLLGSLLVHPYLLAMVLGVLLAVPLSLLARLRLRAALIATLQLAAGMVPLGACILAGGYLESNQPTGFGYYSLNLLSPFIASGSALIPGVAMMDATGGQYEGYSYLGLGGFGLLLLVVTLVWQKQLWRGLRDHAGLALAAIGALLFAVSDQVYLGHDLLGTLPPVPLALQQFRASGRFVWVDLCLLLVAPIALLCQARPRASAPILVALALLQYADTRDLRGSVGDELGRQLPWAVDPALVRPLLAQARLVTLWPTDACQSEMVSDHVFMNLLLLASERAVPINTIPTGRTTGGEECDSSDLTRPSLLPGELRLLLPGSPTNVVAGLPALRPLCHALPGGLVACMDGPALAAFPPMTLATIGLGQTLSLGDPSGAGLRGIGWTASSPDGAWTVGHHASLAGLVPSAPAGLRLRMTGHGLAPDGRPQTVGVTVNGQRVASWQVAAGADVPYAAVLPPGIVAGDALTIELAIAEPARPNDSDGKGDVRLLGFFLRSFRLDPA